MGEYRSLYRDAADNRRHAGAPLPMLVLAVGGDHGVAGAAENLRRIATDVRMVAVPGGGHYVPEERPAGFAPAVLDHLARP